MNLRKYYCILFLFVTLNNIKSQTNFLPGYIITNYDDTISGLIDYRGDIRNSINCSFKINEDAECTTYKPFEIKAYRFIDSKFYISKNVPNTENPDLPVFVEFLVNGLSDLYYYRDHSGDHYLISKNEGTLLELNNDEEIFYIDDKEYSRKSNNYIGLLSAALNDCNEIKDEIQGSVLSHRSLIKVIKDYNNLVCKDQQCIIYEKRLPPFKLQFSPFIGLSFSSLTIKYDRFFSKFDYRSDISSSIGLLASISLPRLNEKFSLQFSSSLSKKYYYGYSYVRTYIANEYNYIHIRVLEPDFIISLKYCYPKGKIRPSMAIGGGQAFFVNNKSRRDLEVQTNNEINSYMFTDIPLPARLTIINYGLGLDYYTRKDKIFFLNVNYSHEKGYKNNIVSNLDSYNINFGYKF